MSDLIAIVYPNAQRAHIVLSAVQRLEQAHLIDLEDAVVVTKDEDDKIRLHQTINMTTRGALGGAFWGSLIGLLLLNPLLGIATGAVAGAAGGALTDFGISDKFMKSLAETMGRETSAIFVLLRRATADKLERELAAYGGRVLHTSLSTEDEERLRVALSGAPAVGTLPTVANAVSLPPT